MSTREDFELSFQRLAKRMDGTLRGGRLQSDTYGPQSSGQAPPNEAIQSL